MNERERAIKLLEETHEFPCDYYLTVIVMNDVSVVADVRMAVQLDQPVGAEAVPYETNVSGKARYLSLRFTVPVRDADQVLAIHRRVKVVRGVVRVI